MAAYGFSNNALIKNNLLFGYKLNDTASTFLRVENTGFRKGAFDWTNVKGYFDSVKVDFVNKYQ